MAKALISDGGGGGAHGGGGGNSGPDRHSIGGFGCGGRCRGGEGDFGGCSTPPPVATAIDCHCKTHHHKDTKIEYLGTSSLP